MFQLWLNLPRKDRWATPRIQILPAEHVPVVNKEGVYMRLYSGSMAGIQSPVQHYTALIVAEFELKAGVGTSVQFPANFNAFLYVISVSLQIAGKAIDHDQVAWLDVVDTEEDSTLTKKGGVLYCMRQNRPTIILFPTGLSLPTPRLRLLTCTNNTKTGP